MRSQPSALATISSAFATVVYYRLMARVPASQFDQSKALIDEFLAS